MKSLSILFALLLVITVGSCVSCSSSQTQNKSLDVTDNVKKSLEQAGLKDVKVSQDRDMGVVTLSGNAQTEGEKAQAESIAKSVAGNLVVSNQISVRPPGEESEAKKVESDLDKAIEKNLDAVLVQHKLDKDVKYDVKNGVVVLKGDVSSQGKRTEVEKLATSVPNVKQVVNEIQVKKQRATASKS